MMKKILVLFFFLILFFPRQSWACDISFSPEPRAVGDTPLVTISQWLDVGQVHSIKISRNGTVLILYQFTPATVTDKWTGRLVMDTGSNVIVAGGPTGVPECQQGRTISAGGDAVNTPPSGWLMSLAPQGVLRAENIDFIKNNFIPFLVSLVLFIIIFLSLLFIIIGGIMWMMSGGDKEALTKAKNTVTYALIGLALGLGSFIIVNVLGNFFGVNLLGP